MNNDNKILERLAKLEERSNHRGLQADEMLMEVKQISAAINKARGGFWVVMVVGGVCGTLGGWALSIWKWH